MVSGAYCCNMKEANASSQELQANCPITCPCGGGVDTTAHRSRKEGICVECGMKVSLD